MTILLTLQILGYFAICFTGGGLWGSLWTGLQNLTWTDWRETTWKGNVVLCFYFGFMFYIAFVLLSLFAVLYLI